MADRTLDEVRVTARGERRLRNGHPWVFRDDIAVAPPGTTGDLVRILGPHGRPLGVAAWSPRSKIALRRIASTDRPPDREFWARRVTAALGLRQRVVEDSEAWRVIFGESDGFTGLIADLYGRHLVVQALTASAEAYLPDVLSAICEHLEPESVLARNDPAVRSLEGLPREVRQIRGTTPERIRVREGPILYEADPWRGQKTGAFLDQRENRLAGAHRAQGRVLDAFCYHGSFALHAAHAGAEVIAVDASADALARGADNARLNGLRGIRFVEANVFEDLRERDRAGERFDLVFLDPPAFAKSRRDLDAARRGYREINLRAIRLLAPDGVLITSSCSYNLTEGMLLEVLAAAAADSGRELRIEERRTQSRDHPIRLGFPESHYLKTVVLQVME
jgi:23S rRNA (cytosine1962-C5)-methyltransferase